MLNLCFPWGQAPAGWWGISKTEEVCWVPSSLSPEDGPVDCASFPVSIRGYLRCCHEPGLHGERWHVLVEFPPGDVGPYGIVGKPGLFLSLTGHAEATFDLDTGLATSFEFEGRINVDLCAVLSRS